jgi:hypothetical protein
MFLNSYRRRLRSEALMRGIVFEERGSETKAGTHLPFEGIRWGRKLKAHTRLLSSRKGRAGSAAIVTLPSAALVRIQLTLLQTVEATDEERAWVISPESRRASMTSRVSSPSRRINVTAPQDRGRLAIDVRAPFDRGSASSAARDTA